MLSPTTECPENVVKKILRDQGWQCVWVRKIFEWRREIGPWWTWETTRVDPTYSGTVVGSQLRASSVGVLYFPYSNILSLNTIYK
jgi:hypothetical protein